MKDIIDEYHENIRVKSAPVQFPLSEEDKQILADMLEYVENSIDEDIAEEYDLRPSVGIAAPQLNIQKQLSVVAFYDEHEEYIEIELINPKIIRYSTQQSYLPGGEGCLSVLRDVEGIVPRPARITVRNHDYDGNAYDIPLDGYAAIVVQHEIDHLKGILFVDKINPNAPFAVPENSKPIIFPEYDDDGELIERPKAE